MLLYAIKSPQLYFKLDATRKTRNGKRVDYHVQREKIGILREQVEVGDAFRAKMFPIYSFF